MNRIDHIADRVVKYGFALLAVTVVGLKKITPKSWWDREEPRVMRYRVEKFVTATAAVMFGLTTVIAIVSTATLGLSPMVIAELVVSPLGTVAMIYCYRISACLDRRAVEEAQR